MLRCTTTDMWMSKLARADAKGIFSDSKEKPDKTEAREYGNKYLSTAQAVRLLEPSEWEG